MGALHNNSAIGSEEESALFPVYHHASWNCITVKQCRELVLSPQRKKRTAKFLKMNPSANDWFGSTRWDTNTKRVT